MPAWSKIRLKLRGKLLLVSLVLMLLPWLGVRYIQAVEGVLQQEQAYTMATIAKASAILVSQYPDILRERLALLENGNSVEMTNVVSMTNTIQVDGYQDDWLDYFSLLKTFPSSNQLIPRQKVDPQNLSVRYLAAQQAQSLVILLDVVDDSIVFRDPSKPERHGSDAIIVALVNQQQRVHRYILSSSSFGSLNAYEYIGSYLDPVIIERYTGIKAGWQSSPYGYRVELKLPLKMAASSMALSVIDTDKGQSEKKILGLGDVRDSAFFSTLLLPSVQLSKVLSDMATGGIRLWLVDNKAQTLASAGQGTVVMDEPELNSIMDLFYQFFLKQAVSDDESLSHEQAVISGEAVSSALRGVAQTERRQTHEGGNVMMVASQPIILDGTMTGAIVAEQNTNAILGLQNKAVVTLLNTTMLVFAIVIAILIGFASRLSFRIRRLNRDVSSVVSGDGRVSGRFSQRVEYDELGELRRGFEQLFDRLASYTHYLEALASRLAHELRTPIAVIRTSLEHLEQSPQDKQVYIDRARTGSERLNNIVARMSEASRLEQTVNNVSLTVFDLKLLLNNLLPIYKDIHPTVNLELDGDSQNVMIKGSQELIVQMLDKLISNAVDFHTEGSSIVLGLQDKTNYCQLTVRNSGIKLPEDMESQLFQPMVSIRQSLEQSENPHLGLGLYIVKLIVDTHAGKVRANNWQQGVEFCIELPITEP